LFKAGDKASLADTVLFALNDRPRWDEMRRAGRRYVEEERNWRSSVSYYQAIYSKLLKNNG
jgi:glycosyltransferase involved in cell wall biosynthesis